MAVVENWGGPGADPADAVQAQCQVVLQDVLLDHGLCWLLELLHQIRIVCTIWDSFFCYTEFCCRTTQKARKSVCIRVCAKITIQSATKLQLVQCAKNKLLADLMCSMALGGSTGHDDISCCMLEAFQTAATEHIKDRSNNELYWTEDHLLG